MRKDSICAIFLIAFSLNSFSAECNQQEPPKLTLQEAQKIALKAVAGEIQHHKLEYEFGRAIYAFVIKISRNESKEVEIDGNTGKVIEIEKDDGRE